MMVHKRWVVAAIVAGLASVAPGQSSIHPSKPKVVQPDGGVPPEQAVKPDESAPLAQTPNYDPPPSPPLPPDPIFNPTPPPLDSPPPPEVKPEPVTTKPVKQNPIKEEPTRLMTPEEQQLEKDSARLLTLAQELKEEVERAGFDTLSLAALRKAEEIQRLSKSLKERMRLQSQVVPTR